MWLELYTKDEVVEFLMLVLKQTFSLKQHTNMILWLMNTKPYKSVFSNILFQALFCRDQETLWWEPWLASQPNQLERFGHSVAYCGEFPSVKRILLLLEFSLLFYSAGNCHIIQI